MQASIASLYIPYQKPELSAIERHYCDSVVVEQGDNLSVVTAGEFDLNVTRKRGFLELKLPGELPLSADGEVCLPFDQAIGFEPPSSLYVNLAKSAFFATCSGEMPNVGIIPCGKIAVSQRASGNPILQLPIELNPYAIENFILYGDEPMRRQNDFLPYASFHLACYGVYGFLVSFRGLANSMQLADGQLRVFAMSQLERIRVERLAV